MQQKINAEDIHAALAATLAPLGAQALAMLCAHFLLDDDKVLADLEA